MFSQIVPQNIEGIVTAQLVKQAGFRSAAAIWEEEVF